MNLASMFNGQASSKVRGLEDEVENLRRMLKRAEDNCEFFQEENWELKKTIAAVYHRMPEVLTPRADAERLLSLAGNSDSELWKVVLSYVDEHERNEVQTALGPDLNDGVRQYNAGRAAGATDFAYGLRELMVRADREAKKIG